jgi:uncharacterized membrane protein YkoI
MPVIVDDNGTAGIISMDAARAKAMSAEPGRIANSSLILNDAGQPVYVFDIRNGDMSHIIRVNALTGRVVGRDTIERRSGYFHRPFSALNSDED